MSLESALAPFAYQLQLVDYLKSEEPDLWQWFASAKYRDEYAESVRLELLKATYRFDPNDHARIYELANAAREVLGLEAPLTIYQSTESEGMNASLAFVPGEIHIILHGNVTSLLTETELQAALAHELTHYAIWERFDRALFIAWQLLGAIAAHPGAANSHLESLRLLALYNEIHADRGALLVTQDALATIRSLIKIQTGLADVNAESYLRQADEIFSRENVKAKQLTHPESFIRARALRVDATEVARMIEGERDLESLDLVGQRRMTKLTRELISSLLAPQWFRTDAVMAHARKFFPDIAPVSRFDDSLSATISALDRPTQQYLTYVMLDFVVADPELEDVPVAAVLDAADRCGIREQMMDVLMKEIALPKKRLAKIEIERAQMLAAAEAQAAR